MERIKLNDMTPKEKANELIEKFKPYANDGYHELTGIDKKMLQASSTIAAMVCVEEILLVIKPIYGCHDEYDFLKDVLKELEKKACY